LFSGAPKEFDKDEQIKKQSPIVPFQHYVQTTNIKTSLEKKKYRIDDGKNLYFLFIHVVVFPGVVGP
jgi:hypothetical protein